MDILLFYLQVKQTLEDILDKVPEPFNTTDMMARVDEQTPYVIVSFQECERMNILMNEINRSLKELLLGLKVSIINKVDRYYIWIDNLNFTIFTCIF